MKYAFIVLIAIYLLTYGCSPDQSDENSTDHEKSAKTNVEQQHQEAPAEVKAVIPEATAEHVEETTQTVVEEQTVIEPVPVSKTEENVSADQPKEVAATPAITDEQQTTALPCGRTLTSEEMADQTAPPCVKALARTSGTPDQEPAPDISAALQEMVDATNDMVMVTRQLVIATQAMIDATQNAAPETAEEHPEK